MHLLPLSKHQHASHVHDDEASQKPKHVCDGEDGHPLALGHLLCDIKRDVEYGSCADGKEKYGGGGGIGETAYERASDGWGACQNAHHHQMHEKTADEAEGPCQRGYN